MARATRAEIRSGRRRLLATLFVVVGAFAIFSMTLSFLGPEFTDFLQRGPVAVRAGFLILAVGVLVLAWERERDLDAMSDALERQEVLIASFDNRLQSLRALLEPGDEPSEPPSMNDALRIVLNAAVDIAGADAGTVEFIAEPDQILTRTFALTDKNGSPRPELRVPLLAEGRKVGGLTLVMPDDRTAVDETALTALRHFSEQAGLALDRARVVAQKREGGAYTKAANVVKSRFLATVSHELRTPLTSIMGYSATLDNHWDRLSETQRHEFVGAIEQQAEKLARLVERMLDAARVEMEGVSVTPVVHDVRMSVHTALRPFVATELGRVQAIVPDGPLEAELDPFVIHQVVSNLVDNAIRYTTGPVRVEVEGSHREVRILVSDSGEGIPAPRLRALEEGLYNVEESATSGTGLGLHVVRTLVRDHGGRMRISSDATGTRVEIRLGPEAAPKIESPTA